MYRHIFMTGVVDGVTDQQVEKMISGMRLFPENISQIRNQTVSVPARTNRDEYRIVLVDDFDNEKDWEIYMEHPFHKAFGEWAAPLMDQSTWIIIQIEI